MKHKIATKVFLFFLITLLVFTVFMRLLYSFLIIRQTTKLYESDLKKRAKMTARIYSRLEPDSSGDSLRALRIVREMVMAEIWLVNEDMSVITIKGRGLPPPDFNHNHSHKKNMMPKEFIPEPGKLPAGADSVIKKAFGGETVISDNFNSMLEVRSITIGTPVISADGKITAVLLFHSPVKGLHEAILVWKRLFIISVAAAFVIALAAGIVLSISFTRPLKLMNDAVKKLGEGNYDISTGVKQKNELGDLAATLDILAERLSTAASESEHMEKMRQNFVANISHELRTPVTVIRGSLEALCDGVITEPEQIKEYYSQMLSETKHLHRLVNDLLELSRLQAVDFKIEKSPFDMTLCVEDAVRSIRKKACEKNIEVHLEKIGMPGEQVGDYGRVRQLFLTILDNAVKFSPENSLVSVRIYSDKIEIQDGGIGIKPEEISEIFKRFRKTNDASNKDGTGLGLAIAKEIAERHSYVLECESPASNKISEFPGALFRVRIS